MLSDSKDGLDDAKPCMIVNDLLVVNDLLDMVVNDLLDMVVNDLLDMLVNDLLDMVLNEYEISFTNALSLKVLVVI